MALNFVPVRDKVLVKRCEAEEQSRGGIFIPDSAQKARTEGMVMAVGPGRFEDGGLIPMSVKKGDRVVFSSYEGNEVMVNGEKMVVIDNYDILGIVEE